MNYNSNMEQKNALILIVDDNPRNIQVVGNHLKDKGIDIAIATSGKKGLEIASARKPDLVLLDIMMPEMDGYEVCENLKKNPETMNIPIIFLTAKVNKEDILQGFKLGAVDYIVKPFNSSELIARVNTHLKLKLYRDRIEEINEQLQMADIEKNEFLGIAAHDLKNPIYSISMLAKVIRDEENLKRDEVVEFSQDIITTADRMLDLIKNLLDINAIEQGKVKIIPENFNPLEIIVSIVESYKERAKAKNINLSIENGSNSFLIFADKNALIQVLDNLISNAIKFSPFGKNIYVALGEKDDNGIIEIRDEGPGIGEDDMKKLFGKFCRLSAQPTGNENSTGLGLSIVKKYIDSMNGSIWCESEPGNGASFFVALPKASQ